MKRLFCCLTVLFLLGAVQCWAAERCASPLGRTLKCTRCAAVPCCCPDDYCRKPFPCIPCGPLPTTADCYCRKPMPCIPCCCIPCCPDDYCRKPFPTFCWKVNKECYRCPPCESGSGTENAAGRSASRQCCGK
ncbi:MAG: hypothetical protein LLG00_04190 [Planctomycetaceae bacterium]|nr:hypothetical protein [Planctomycetaceae bacterium]